MIELYAALLLAWISTERNRANAGLTQGIHLTRYFGADSTEGDPTNIGIAKGFMRLGNLLLLVSQYGALIDNPAWRHSTSRSSNYGEIVAMRSKETPRNQAIRTPFRITKLGPKWLKNRSLREHNVR